MADPKVHFIEPAELGTSREQDSVATCSEKILKAELKRIQNRRSDAADGNLTGLALSGGGIRSATFSLGVMQALAHAHHLKRFDYLSTVSGGGYIGSSITWLASKAAGGDYGVERDNFPYGTGKKSMLKYLRQRGNYLVPGGGISLMSGIAVAIRGTLLNLIVWVPLMIVVMMAMQSVKGPVEDVSNWTYGFDPAKADSLYPFLFRESYFLAVRFAEIFLIFCVLYSLLTWFDFLPRALRYRGRRSFERAAGPLLGAIGLFFVIGTLPLVHDWIFSWIGKDNEIGEAGGAGAFLASGLAFGFRAYRRSKSDTDPGRIPLSVIATLAAVLVLYGMFLFSYQMADNLSDGAKTISLFGLFAFSVTGPEAGLGLVAISVATGWGVNLNLISLHRFYRDRLMEAFMPDVKSVDANKTGAAKGADEASLHKVWWDRDVKNPEGPNGPYHIVNTNVVTVDSKIRSLRMRGGDNFILSPLYCGSNATGWQDSKDFVRGGMTLATAMAISGAAANPNAGVGGKGVTRNSVVSLLMSILNIRLGYWIRRPARCNSRLTMNKPNHFFPGLYEIGGILGLGYRENRRFVQLSDGGHFENFGLYELIRRRLKLIVVCDGGADEDFEFGDLQNALERINEDFGVTTDLATPPTLLDPLIPKGPCTLFPQGVKLADRGYIVGKITYPGSKEEGTLIYLKTTMVRKLSLRTMGYKGAHPAFPDESTADQFFDEDQFDAYRELGYVIAGEMIKNENLEHLMGPARPEG